MNWKKDKRTLIVLLPAVVAVWGIIAWRIASGMQGNNQNYTLVEKNSPITVSKEAKKLKLNYREPFVVVSREPKKHIQNGQEPRREITVKKEEKPLKVEPIQWPAIAYLGMIKNLSTQNHTAVLQHKNQTEMVHIGQSWMEIKLLTCKEDSVFLEYKKEKRWIRKK